MQAKIPTIAPLQAPSYGTPLLQSCLSCWTSFREGSSRALTRKRRGAAGVLQGWGTPGVSLDYFNLIFCTYILNYIMIYYIRVCFFLNSLSLYIFLCQQSCESVLLCKATRKTLENCSKTTKCESIVVKNTGNLRIPAKIVVKQM